MRGAFRKRKSIRLSNDTVASSHASGSELAAVISAAAFEHLPPAFPHPPARSLVVAPAHGGPTAAACPPHASLGSPHLTLLIPLPSCALFVFALLTHHAVSRASLLRHAIICPRAVCDLTRPFPVHSAPDVSGTAASRPTWPAATRSLARYPPQQCYLDHAFSLSEYGYLAADCVESAAGLCLHGSPSQTERCHRASNLRAGAADTSSLSVATS